MEFDMARWMAGENFPIETGQKKPEKREYFYGVYMLNSKYVKFITRDKSKVPPNAIVVKNVIERGAIVEKLAFDLITDFINPKMPKICAGSIVHHIDQCGQHTAVVLYRANYSKILMITTNPNWNTNCRLITDDEQIFLGYPNRGKQSYFAPVVRSIDDLSMPYGEFPRHRVLELRKEFKNSFGR